MKKNAFIFSVIFMMYLPIIVLILYAFNDAQYSMQIKQFSLKWFYALFDDPILWQSTFNSFFLATISSTLSTMLAAISAFSLYFYAFKTKKPFQKLLQLMIIIPDIILAIGLLLLFNFMQLKLGFLSLLLAHITFSVPFAIIVVQNRIQSLDKNLLAVCQDLGAFDFYAFRKVFLPLLSASLISAWLLSFTLSFDDVLISYFVSGPEFQTLPLAIYALIRTGIKPEINALCSIIFIVSTICAGLSYQFARKNNTWQ